MFGAALMHQQVEVEMGHVVKQVPFWLVRTSKKFSAKSMLYRIMEVMCSWVHGSEAKRLLTRIGHYDDSALPELERFINY